MQVQKSFKEETIYGTLYLVPTPIGNLQDMTFRSVDILKNVDYIAAEDTRNTGLLLKHFAIKTRQISFHEHNALEKIPVLLDLLKSGKSLAQVSDAGMPSISDPGHNLVTAALKENIPVVALPGASAGLTALIASGLLPQPHTFYGFLPRKSKQQQEFFKKKKDAIETQIFYESPYRLKATLGNLLTVYGDREVVLARELTKLHEEYQRGRITELLTYLKEHPLKGECLLIVAGYDKTVAKVKPAEDFSPQELIQNLIDDGMKPNQAIKKIAKDYDLNRQKLYQIYHGLDS